MFSIPPKTNRRIRFSLVEDLLSDLLSGTAGRQRPDRVRTLEIKGRKKSFLVNCHPIEEGEKTLVLVEDTGRIMSLSAAHSNRTSYTFDDIIGKSPGLLKTKKRAAMVAPTDSGVLLVGESGTGKELFAHAIHAASHRARRPFVAINCGAIPADIIESELFGYEPGAFTGAREAGKPGLLETASGGTLFLDEVEAMPLSFQVKLLRAFSARSLVRVGGVASIPLDIRIIAASKVDLLDEVNHGRFREDLYYRIATFPLYIPALKDRLDDVPILTRHFLDLLSTAYSVEKISADKAFFSALRAYSWRGNVRELRNSIERAVLLGLEEKRLSVIHLPEQVRASWMSGKIRQQASKAVSENSGSGMSILKIAENAAIAMVLEEEAGNISRSAKRLGVARSTLYQKIKAQSELETVLKSYNNKN